MSEKLTLAELMEQKEKFYVAEQRRMNSPGGRIAYEMAIALLRHLIKTEEVQRKDLAKRLDSEINMAWRIRDCLEDFPKFANETKMADALGDALCGIRNTILNSECSKSESEK